MGGSPLLTRADLADHELQWDLLVLADSAGAAALAC